MVGILPLGVIIDTDNPIRYVGSSVTGYTVYSMVGYDTELCVFRDIGSSNDGSWRTSYGDISKLKVSVTTVNGEEVSVQVYVYGKRIQEDIFFAIYDKDLNLHYSSKRYLAVYTEFKCAFVFDAKTKEMKLYHEDIEDAIPDIDSNITIGNIWTGTEQWKAITDKKDTGLYAFNDTLLITSDFMGKEYIVPKEYKNIYIHPYSALESIVLHKDIGILVGRLNHGTTGSTKIKKVFMSKESSEKLLCHVIHLLLYRQGGFVGGSLGSLYKKKGYKEYLEYCRRNNELYTEKYLKDVEIVVY